MTRKLRGFTLVELLVVIAIIGLLVSLLLPAVQSARESARLTECRNHLKQMGLAALLYHEQHKALPAAVGVRFRADPSYVGAWPVQIMPFAEMSARYERYLEVETRLEKADLFAESVALFYCPTRRDAAAYPRAGATRGRQRGYSRIDYAVNGGAARKSGMFSVERPGVSEPDNSAVSVSDVTDGTSTTYLYGEKAMDPDDFEGLGDGVGDDSSPYECHGGACVRFAKNSPSRDVAGIGCYACHDFGSSHQAGWLAAFCDGSVRMRTYAADFAIHQALASRDWGDRPDGVVDFERRRSR